MNKVVGRNVRRVSNFVRDDGKQEVRVRDEVH